MGILKRPIQDIVRQVKESKKAKEQEQERIYEEDEEEFAWVGSDVGESDNEADRDEHPAKPKKRMKRGQQEELSVEEIRRIQMEEEALASKAYLSPVNDLIRKHLVKYEKLGNLESALWRVKEIFENAQEQHAVGKVQAERHLLLGHYISIPFPEPQPKEDIKFEFKRPSKVYLVGSFMGKCVAKCRSAGMHADMAVEMPDSLFCEKDFQNYHYFHKRAFYLAMLASALKDSVQEGIQIKYMHMNNDSRKPILVIEGRDHAEFNFSSTKFSIRVIPVISSNVFKLERLAPARNSVRPSWFDENIEKASDPSMLPPTPWYNSLIMQDVFMENHMQYYYKCAKVAEMDYDSSFSKAACLLRVWLKNIGFDDGSCGGMNGFVLTMFLAWLWNSKRVTLSSDPYMLFKATLQMIASIKDNQSVFLSESGKALQDEGPFSVKEFSKNFDVVLVDPSGYVNLLAGMNSSQWKEFRYRASVSCDYLKERTISGFEKVFDARERTPLEVFDYVCTVKEFPSYTEERHTKVIVNEGSMINYAVKVASDVLQKGLRDRVVFASPKKITSAAFELNQKGPDYSGLTIGVVIDDENCYRAMDLGPSNDDVEASNAFKDLWGEKCELRKFKDGRLLETVFWGVPEAASFSEKAGIIEKACKYLISRHLTVSENRISFFGNQIQKVLAPSEDIMGSKTLKPQYQTFASVMKDFESFSKSLRQIEDGLPLRIVDVSPACPELRYSSVVIPQPREAFINTARSTYVPPYKAALSLVIEFESSTRWPSELDAVQNMKKTLMCSVAEKYMEQFPASKCSVVCDNSHSAENMQFAGHLEIVTEGGMAFKCFVRYRFEEKMLLNWIQSGKTPSDKKKAYRDSLDFYRKNLIVIPLLSLKVQAIIRKHPVLSNIIRVVKSWFAAHGLLTPCMQTHFTDESIELLCIYAVLREKRAFSTWSGFMSVISLLASWNWRDEALVVNTNVDEDAKKSFTETEIEDAIYKQRKTDPNGTHCAMFIIPDVENNIAASEEDWIKNWCLNSTFTRSNPRRLVLETSQKLAKETIKLVHSIDVMKINGDGLYAYTRGMFTLNQKVFDIVIKMVPECCPRYFESSNAKIENIKYEEKFKNVSSAKTAGFLCLDFDPVDRFMADLEKAFGTFMICFANRHNGTSIGIVIDPRVLQPVRISSSLLFPFKTVDDDEDEPKFCKLDLDGLVSQIRGIGEGLIASIEKNE
ncbi:hypothetical protein MP638_006526 [Amoeboaphelidium occidentale]|nr:hypothetical protein MP638_006526 [Amoeboaphelidium occidentale]